MSQDTCKFSDVIRARTPRELREAVEVAADHELTTASAYVRRAVLAALQRDGFLNNEQRAS